MILILLVAISLAGISAASDNIYFEKIGNGPSQWRAKYAIMVNLDSYTQRVDEIVLPVATIDDIYRNKEAKLRMRFDINKDGIDDWIIRIRIGRGCPELFYIIDGKNKKLIFHHLKCRKNISYQGLVDKTSPEGRGYRIFTFGPGWIKETLSIPYFPKGYDTSKVENCIDDFIYQWEKNQFIQTNHQRKIN